MTDEDKDLNGLFEAIGKAARAGTPFEGINETERLVYGFLVILFKAFKDKIISEKEMKSLGGMCRTWFVSATKKENQSLKNGRIANQRNHKCGQTLAKLNKSADKMSAAEREQCYLDIIYSVNSVSAKIIREKIQKQNGNADEIKKIFDELESKCEVKELPWIMKKIVRLIELVCGKTEANMLMKSFKKAGLIPERSKK